MSIGYVNSDKFTMREMDELVASIEAFSSINQLVMDAERVLCEHEQVLKDLEVARAAIQEYKATECVIASLDGADHAFTSAMEGVGIDIAPSRYGTDGLQEDLLKGIDTCATESLQSMWEAFKQFLAKIWDWIKGLFSANQRMLNLFKKAQKLYNAKDIDAKAFEEIRIAKGLELKDFGMIGNLVINFDKKISPLLTSWIGFTSMISHKVLAEDPEAIKKANEAVNMVNKMGLAIMALAKVGPKGLVTIDQKDGSEGEITIGDYSFDYSVITVDDKTCKELNFTPVVLDACIDNAANVLISVNRYGTSLQRTNKMFEGMYQSASRNSNAPDIDRQNASRIMVAFRHFNTSCRFMQQGSSIMSRQIYTMLKQAKLVKVSEDEKAANAKDVTPGKTFGQLLLA